jgi:hypothetical protein
MALGQGALRCGSKALRHTGTTGGMTTTLRNRARCSGSCPRTKDSGCSTTRRAPSRGPAWRSSSGMSPTACEPVRNMGWAWPVRLIYDQMEPPLIEEASESARAATCLRLRPPQSEPSLTHNQAHVLDTAPEGPRSSQSHARMLAVLGWRVCDQDHRLCSFRSGGCASGRLYGYVGRSPPCA